MDTIQRKKNRIQKREQAAHSAFSLLLLTVFALEVSLFAFLRTTPVAQTITTLNGWWLPLSFSLLFFFIVGLGISQLGPFMQETQRQKQHWLNAYGQQIQAVVNKYPEENALVVGGSIRGRGTSSRRYLHWQDPQTTQRYSFCVNTRFSSALRNLPEGALYPVQFDPDDLSFFVVPGK
jgi:hypothetical protein